MRLLRLNCNFLSIALKGLQAFLWVTTRVPKDRALGLGKKYVHNDVKPYDRFIS